MKYPEDFINKLICIDSQEGMRDIPDGSIDLIVTDPPYGYAFMQRNWDKALVNIETWQECLRVLKPGAFAFIMCAPRQDVLSRQIINLEEAGFITGFSSIYWTYASGFPKAQNISKQVDKRAGIEREVVGYRTRPDGSNPRVNVNAHSAQFGNSDSNDQMETAPATPEAKDLNGSYGGFQPKPAVEVILVVMKPLSEKTYVDQALKNGKGITWLDNGRIPYKGKNDFVISHHNKHLEKKNKSTGIFGATNGYGLLESDISQGRFPANLLVSEDVLNDGKGHKSSRGGGQSSDKTMSQFGIGVGGYKSENQYYDFGSFSRYFDLDKWWRERSKKLSKQPCFICGYIEEHGNYIDADGRIYCDECLISGNYLDLPKLNIKGMPKSVQKTFPFLIVPKASKAEKNRGCEKLEEKVRADINKMMGKAGNFKTGSGNIRTVKFKNHHPTVKPIKLMSYLIILGSRPNDIILDPFVGSGTTCIAAKMLNRRYIGFDNDEGYIEIAQCRIRAIEAVLI